MERPNIPLNCFFKGSYNPAYYHDIRQAKDKCWQYNNLHPNDDAGHDKILRELFGKVGKEATVVAPFWCDYGYHIEAGDYFYANHNVIMQDGGGIKFGDYVFIAPNVLLTTAEYALDPQMRMDGVEIAKPITIGNNVWIGSGAVILAGTTIGDNTVIGAGSVVKGNIPSGVVAAGVPCRVIREITEADRHTYPFITMVRID